jgi:hypothetical protein
MPNAVKLTYIRTCLSQNFLLALEMEALSCVLPEVYLRRASPVTNGKELSLTIDRIHAKYLNSLLVKVKGKKLGGKLIKSENRLKLQELKNERSERNTK